MKIKTFIISAITIFISLYLIIGYHSLKHIDKNRIDVSKYITLVDEVSENKVQVNWKYVVSIIAVENKNKIKIKKWKSFMNLMKTNKYIKEIDKYE